jgi:hypothetical protein
MSKGYISNFKKCETEGKWFEDISFDSDPERAWNWATREGAEIDCMDLNRGVEIPSSKGGFFMLSGFKIEERPRGEFLIFCEGPFIPDTAK